MNSLITFMNTYKKTSIVIYLNKKEYDSYINNLKNPIVFLSAEDNYHILQEDNISKILLDNKY